MEETQRELGQAHRDLAALMRSAPMANLRRLEQGFAGALRFVWNLLRDSEARRRVLEMRSVLRRQRKHLGAVAITGRKR